MLGLLLSTLLQSLVVVRGLSWLLRAVACPPSGIDIARLFQALRFLPTNQLTLSSVDAKEIRARERQENLSRFSVRVFRFSFRKSGPVHTPMAPAGGRMAVGVYVFLQYGNRIPRLGLSQRCAIWKWCVVCVCVLSRSSTAHVLAHVSLENPLRLSKAGARALGFAGLVPVSVVPIVSDWTSVKRYIEKRLVKDAAR